jgi:hypothetical protein
VLTRLEAYSSWLSAPALPLSDNGREETDLIQIRNIDGLDPVKATVNTAPFGSVDGTAYTGSDVSNRNIVLTLHPNPDWNTWKFESLRRLLYAYFMPKLQTRFIFYSDDIPPVEIYGYVEGCSVNPFSKDVEVQVSVICTDPYFTALDPTIILGQSARDNSNPTKVQYNGSIATGINLQVTRTSGATPTSIGVQIGDPGLSHFRVTAGVDATKYLSMGSLPGQKFVQNVAYSNGVITNLLSKIQAGSSWPILQPGENDFSIITDTGVQDWKLTYFERYGGL